MPASSRVEAWLVLMILLRNNTFLIRNGCSSGSLLRAPVSPWWVDAVTKFMTDPSFGSCVECGVRRRDNGRRIIGGLRRQQLRLGAMAADRGALRQAPHGGNLRLAHALEPHCAATDERARRRRGPDRGAARGFRQMEPT